MDKPKNITIRVPYDMWEKWDRFIYDKRDSWQRIGMDLFSGYFRKFTEPEQRLNPEPSRSNDTLHSLLTAIEPGAPFHSHDAELHTLLAAIEPGGRLGEKLLEILRSGNPSAIHALAVLINGFYMESQRRPPTKAG